MKKTASAVKKLMELSPDTANVLRDVKEYTVPTSEVGIGELLLVKAGAKIPLDGVVTKGESSADESMLTGESLPVTKTVGSEVIGGSINLNGVIYVKVTRVGGDNEVAGGGALPQAVKGAGGENEAAFHRKVSFAESFWIVYHFWRFRARRTARPFRQAALHSICSSQKLSNTRKPISPGSATGNSAMVTGSNSGHSRFSGSRRRTGVLSFRRLLTYRIRITPASVWAKRGGFMRILTKNGRPNGRPFKI